MFNGILFAFSQNESSFKSLFRLLVILEILFWILSRHVSSAKWKDWEFYGILKIIDKNQKLKKKIKKNQKLHMFWQPATLMKGGKVIWSMIFWWIVAPEDQTKNFNP